MEVNWILHLYLIAHCRFEEFHAVYQLVSRCASSRGTEVVQTILKEKKKRKREREKKKFVASYVLGVFTEEPKVNFPLLSSRVYFSTPLIWKLIKTLPSKQALISIEEVQVYLLTWSYYAHLLIYFLRWRREMHRLDAFKSKCEWVKCFNYPPEYLAVIFINSYNCVEWKQRRSNWINDPNLDWALKLFWKQPLGREV